jgi:hypothetical protein
MTLDAPTARELAKAALIRAAGPNHALMLTPPFPQHWPPAGPAMVVYCAYLTRSLPTSGISFEVHAPEYHLALTPRAGATVQVTKLTPRRLSDGTTAPRQSMADLDPAAAALLRIADGSGRPDDRRAVHDAYRTWMEDHASLAGELAQTFPEFFRWLNKDAP